MIYVTCLLEIAFYHRKLPPTWITELHLHGSAIYRSSSILTISTKKRTVFCHGNFVRKNDLFHRAFRYLFAFFERKQAAFELIALASFHLVELDSSLISKIATKQIY